MRLRPCAALSQRPSAFTRSAVILFFGGVARDDATLGGQVLAELLGERRDEIEPHLRHVANIPQRLRLPSKRRRTSRLPGVFRGKAGERYI
jgi:hypothetical protein